MEYYIAIKRMNNRYIINNMNDSQKHYTIQNKPDSNNLCFMVLFKKAFERDKILLIKID